MKMVYIQFQTPIRVNKNKKENPINHFIKSIFISLLTKIFPMANPDFDDKIESVEWWLLECENESGIPQREIGLDKHEQMIMKMPVGENYGFWTNNNLLLNDFIQRFNILKFPKRILRDNEYCLIKWMPQYK